MENMNEHTDEKNTMPNFFPGYTSHLSFSEETGNQGYYDTDYDHGGDGEVYLKIRPVNNNIPRQPSYWQLSQPWPEQSDSQKYHSQYDQRFLHRVVLPSKKKLPLGQFLQQPFDHIAVGTLAEMLHYRPHGLHGTLKFGKINIFINPGQHFFPACHSGQV